MTRVGRQSCGSWQGCHSD